MIYDVLMVAVHTLAAVAAAAILVFGFVFLIFLGDANARDRPLVSRGFDGFAAVVLYLSWFGLLWWFGFSQVLLMVACGATMMLAVVYAASFHVTRRRTVASQGSSEGPMRASGGQTRAA